jgi:CubicO group peptidase (beta-lactamase class C family)
MAAAFRGKTADTLIPAGHPTRRREERRMPATDSAQHWRDRLADLATRLRVPGATLGIWAGGQEMLAAHGVLNTATGVGVTTGSLFQIGSITKVWTATMIMQLAAEGRLSLDSPVAEILPGVPVGTPDGTAEITVRHLLTHTSGLEGDIFTDTGRGGGCVRRYVAGLRTAARVFPPGAAYSYCNSGFVLLGRIIEVLDGGEWDASLRRRLIEPLGLAQTVTLPEEAILHRAATGHRGPPREEPVTVWGLPRSVGPASLITTSVHDLLSFARMHLDGGHGRDGTSLLGADAVTAMQQRQAPMTTITGGADAIGLGWRLHSWDDRSLIGHDGGTVGQQAYLLVAPGAGVAACLLTNTANPRTFARELFAEVFGTYAGMRPPPEPEPAAWPVDLDPHRHAGHYERAGRRFDVSVRDGRPHLVTALTGPLGELAGGPAEEMVLHPADSTGDHFVARTEPDEPWTPFSFARLGDGTRYLYCRGRVSPRTG